MVYYIILYICRMFEKSCQDKFEVPSSISSEVVKPSKTPTSAKKEGRKSGVKKPVKSLEVAAQEPKDVTAEGAMSVFEAEVKVAMAAATPEKKEASAEEPVKKETLVTVEPEPEKLTGRGRVRKSTAKAKEEIAEELVTKAVMKRTGKRKSIAQLEEEPVVKTEDVAMKRGTRGRTVPVKSTSSSDGNGDASVKPEAGKRNRRFVIAKTIPEDEDSKPAIETEEKESEPATKSGRASRKNTVTETLSKSITEERPTSKSRASKLGRKGLKSLLNSSKNEEQEEAENAMNQVDTEPFVPATIVPESEAEPALNDVDTEPFEPEAPVPEAVKKKSSRKASIKPEPKLKVMKKNVVEVEVEKSPEPASRRGRGSRKLPGVASVSVMLTDSPVPGTKEEVSVNASAFKEKVEEGPSVEPKKRNIRKGRGKVDTSPKANDSVEDLVNSTKTSKEGSRSRKISLDDFTPKSRKKMGESVNKTSEPEGMDMSITVTDTAAFRARLQEGEVELVASKSVSPKAAPKRGRGKKVEAGNATVAVVERAEPPVKRGRRGKELDRGMEMTVTVDDCKVKEAPVQKVPSSSNRSRKRAADASPESSPSNKRHSSISSCGSARGGKATSLACSSPSLRGVTRHQVMFTGFISEKDSALVEELGGRLTEVVSECTVLVADTMKRTVKLLCMAGP